MEQKEKVVGIPKITSDDIVPLSLDYSEKRIEHSYLFKWPECIEEPTVSMKELWNNRKKIQS